MDQVETFNEALRRVEVLKEAMLRIERLTDKSDDAVVDRIRKVAATALEKSKALEASRGNY